MRALIRFDCFGVIFMTMIFISSQFDPLICRACCFLQMLFLLPSGSVAKSYPIRIVIQFSKYNEKVFHLFPLGSTKLSGVYENFLSGKKPSHLFGIAKPNDTLFHRKNEKIFFGLRVLYFSCPEKPLHLFPPGASKCTP